MTWVAMGVGVLVGAVGLYMAVRSSKSVRVIDDANERERVTTGLRQRTLAQWYFLVAVVGTIGVILLTVGQILPAVLALASALIGGLVILYLRGLLTSNAN
jgi:hypothetical protein